MNDTKFHLWSAGLPKEQRDSIADRVEAILWALRS